MTQHSIRFQIEETLAEALAQRKRQTGQTLKQILENALNQYLELEQSEVFQTSTINAVEEKVYKGDNTIEESKKHGDFGLGFFEDLDATEMNDLYPHLHHKNSLAIITCSKCHAKIPATYMYCCDCGTKL